MKDGQAQRRTIPTRSKRWAVETARTLQALGLKPNQISIASVIAAAIGCIALVASGDSSEGARLALVVVAALMIPLRLLCNMLDGMLAVEGGMQSPAGDIYNELPDRIADVLFIAGAGYAARDIDGAITLGWIAATLAVLTAYVRTLGAANGVPNDFTGPLAKPQRMHVLIAACLLTIIEIATQWTPGVVFVIALSIIAVGSAITVARRLIRIMRRLEAS